jgi:Domain of unknown function (DUF5911)
MMRWTIHSHAALGDGRSVALVSDDGSLTWLCWPRFDSPALFAGLLDTSRGGAWQLRPTGRFRVERCYHHDSNVLRTTFHTSGGRLRLTDAMPVVPDRQRPLRLRPEHELVRHLTCEEGEVELDVHFAPRPDWGHSRARLREGGTLGWRAVGRAADLRGPVPGGGRAQRPGTQAPRQAAGAGGGCYRPRRARTPTCAPHATGPQCLLCSESPRSPRIVSTLPSGNSVAVWKVRAVARAPVGLHVPVAWSAWGSLPL